MVSEKLKNCPFCAGEVKSYIGISGIRMFRCKDKANCGAVVSFDNDRTYADHVAGGERRALTIAAWNRRATPWETDSWELEDGKVKAVWYGGTRYVREDDE